MQKKHDIAKILFRLVAGLYGFISEVSVTFSDGIERVLSSGGCSPARRFPKRPIAILAVEGILRSHGASSRTWHQAPFIG